jgi:hypothetical protein
MKRIAFLVWLPFLFSGCATMSKTGTPTPPLSIKLVELRRVPSDTGTQVFYKPHFQGLRPGKNYELYTQIKGVTEKPALTERFVPTSQGWVGLARKKLMDNYELAANGFQKGLGMEIIVAGPGGKETASDKVFPFPIEARDGGCRVWLQLIDRNGKVFEVGGTGFFPGEVLTTLSISGNEKVPGRFPSSSGGEFPAVILMPENSEGVHRARFEVKGQNCAPAVDYTWGEEALKPQ